MRNMDENTQLRHLPPGIIFKLGQLLDEKGWKDVMANIPVNPLDLSSSPKYKVDQIRLIENFGEKHNMSFTELLLDEWGTSGKIRPTLQTLLDVLIKTELFRAADYVAVDLLKQDPPRRPSDGPAAFTNTNIEDLVMPSVESNLVNLQIHSETDLSHMPYFLLSEITNNFDDTPLDVDSNVGCVNGHKIGAGAFGTVYYGVLPDGQAVAVKKLQNDAVTLFQQFQSEITMLSVYKHPNLLPLLGYSCDTFDYCLVYEFMPNRSLQDRLAVTNSNLILNWKQRLDIAIGVCRAIHYLHTARELPLIHRDIKTANILLDRLLEPRLGDFGLVKISPTDSRMTSTVFGTSAYMAPEAFRGDVSVKTDVFSFGVVLLELLTGLPPYDGNRDGADIITYVEGIIEDDEIEPLLDGKAAWNLRVGHDIYALTQLCFEDKRKRPVIAEVLDSLSHMLENISVA